MVLCLFNEIERFPRGGIFRVNTFFFMCMGIRRLRSSKGVENFQELRYHEGRD